MTAPARTFEVILWHPGGERTARSAQGWPRLVLAPDSNPAEAAREQWGTAVWTLHDGGLAAGHRAALHLQALEETLPCALSWQDAELPALSHARPWQRPGWRAEVLTWLRQQGVEPQTVEPVSSTDLSAVLRVGAPGRTLYLKVSDSPQEARVTAYLSRTHPELLPPLVAADAARGWQLSESGGVLLDGVGEWPAWEEALRTLAHVQTSADAAALAGLGCPARPLTEMTERVDEFLADTAALTGWGLAPEQAETLQAARPQIRRGFGQLTALGMPDLPAHGDAHPRNALWGEHGVRWFDWSEAKAAAHPLMDAGWFLSSLLHPARQGLPIRQAVPDLEARLCQVYARALGCPDAQERLGGAIPLALLHRAAVYDETFRTWEGTLPGWRPNYVPYYLRQAIGALPRL